MKGQPLLTCVRKDKQNLLENAGIISFFTLQQSEAHALLIRFSSKFDQSKGKTSKNLPRK